MIGSDLATMLRRLNYGDSTRFTGVGALLGTHLFALLFVNLKPEVPGLCYRSNCQTAKKQPGFPLLVIEVLKYRYRCGHNKSDVFSIQTLLKQIKISISLFINTIH